MKKIFFLLLTTLLFISCSQDESITEVPNKDSKDSVAVTFKIGTPFSVEVGDLKSGSLYEGEPLYFRYLVYDWNGNFHKEQLGDFTFYRNQGFQINDFLTMGQYHIAIMASSNRDEIENFVPSNYFEDIYRQDLENSKMYYETFEYDTRENYRSVTLSPMFIEIIVNLERWQNGIPEPDNISLLDLYFGGLGDAFNISTKETVSSNSKGINFMGSDQMPVFHHQLTCFAAQAEREIYMKAHIIKEGGGQPTQDMVAIIDAKRGQRAHIHGNLSQYLNFNIQVDDELEDVLFELKPY